MFTHWGSRKREREDDDTATTPGFGEHRSVSFPSRPLMLCNSSNNQAQKRHISALPHRTSPTVARNLSPTFSWGDHYTSQPALSTITPAVSHSEDAAVSAEPRSFFSSYTSPIPAMITHGGSHSVQMPNAAMYSDDFEMLDAAHPSPVRVKNDSAPGISSRIPTPIHSSFAPFIRTDKASINGPLDSADDEALIERFRRGRGLPSPISEDETSPSVIVAGFSDMQMDVESSSQPVPVMETPTKKGHTRSKHSLRAWTGNGSELPGGGGQKRSFSLGYRADCEKCRMKVPGHFSHIITY